jgi:hypothetical protein
MTRRTVLLTFAIGILGALVGGATVVWADHQFSDVADGHAFHDQIGAVVDAGCATGFDDGTFRPGTSPTRGQFAYWLNNCGGRAAYGATNASFLNDSNHVRSGLAEARLNVGAQGDGLAIVVVIGTGNIDASADGSVAWTIESDDGTTTQEIASANDTIYSPPGATINPGSSVTLVGTVVVPAGEFRDFSMTVTRADGIPLANIETDLVAMSFPFNGEGGAGAPLD